MPGPSDLRADTSRVKTSETSQVSQKVTLASGLTLSSVRLPYSIIACRPLETFRLIDSASFNGRTSFRPVKKGRPGGFVSKWKIKDVSTKICILKNKIYFLG